MLADDIALAQKIVSGSNFNVSLQGQPYHSSSFIYRKTNEKINEYQTYLQGRKKVASVIASGNQILNSVYEGANDITAFDISSFPEYYFKLQLAAISVYLRDELCDFLYNDSMNDEVKDDMYFGINTKLDFETKKFWDSLFQFFDWSDIKQSTLFSSDAIFLDQVIEQNKYLQSDVCYEQLRHNLRDTNFDFYTGDICSLAKNFPVEYDFINLSSIVYYKKIAEYQQLLKELPLQEQGQVLTYLYDVLQVEDSLAMPNCSFEKFSNDSSGVMIYTKRK